MVEENGTGVRPTVIKIRNYYTYEKRIVIIVKFVVKFISIYQLPVEIEASLYNGLLHISTLFALLLIKLNDVPANVVVDLVGTITMPDIKLHDPYHSIKKEMMMLSLITVDVSEDAKLLDPTIDIFVSCPCFALHIAPFWVVVVIVRT